MREFGSEDGGYWVCVGNRHPKHGPAGYPTKAANGRVLREGNCQVRANAAEMTTERPDTLRAEQQCVNPLE